MWAASKDVMMVVLLVATKVVEKVALWVEQMVHDSDVTKVVELVVRWVVVMVLWMVDP